MTRLFVVVFLALFGLLLWLLGLLLWSLLQDDSGLPAVPATADAPAPPPDATVAPANLSEATSPPSSEGAGLQALGEATLPTTELPTVQPAPKPDRIETDDIWQRLAECESGGDWHTYDRLHSGGLQFAYATWRAAGGTRYAPNAHEATREQQIEVAKGWLARTSPMQWPVCGRRVGLTMEDAQ